MFIEPDVAGGGMATTEVEGYNATPPLAQNTTIRTIDLNDEGNLNANVTIWNSTVTMYRNGVAGISTFPILDGTYNLNLTTETHINRTNLILITNGVEAQHNFTLWEAEVSINLRDFWRGAFFDDGDITNFTVSQQLESNTTTSGSLIIRSQVIAPLFTFSFVNRSSYNAYPDYTVTHNLTLFSTDGNFTGFIPYGTVNMSATNILTGGKVSIFTVRQNDSLGNEMQLGTSSGLLQMNNSPDIFFNFKLLAGEQTNSDTATLNTTLNFVNITFNSTVFNSIYSILLDEITREEIQNWSLTVISPDFAANFTTTEGNISLELLTPHEYTFVTTLSVMYVPVLVNTVTLPKSMKNR